MRIRSSRQLKTRRQGITQVFLVVAAALILSSSGCSALRGVRDYLHYNDMMDDFAVGWRNHVWANQAWNERKHIFVDEPQLFDFGEGFRAGYSAVASGGNGCPPPLPPRKYWNWKYSSPEGQAKTAAWFAGYPYGAAASEEDGAGLWREIQVSESIAIQYSPEFHSANCACSIHNPGTQGHTPLEPQSAEELPAFESPMSETPHGMNVPQSTDPAVIAPIRFQQPYHPDSAFNRNSVLPPIQRVASHPFRANGTDNTGFAHGPEHSDGPVQGWPTSGTPDDR
jgi:hypothetical protein